jgi:hypothetical protein
MPLSRKGYSSIEEDRRGKNRIFGRPLQMFVTIGRLYHIRRFKLGRYDYLVYHFDCTEKAQLSTRTCYTRHKAQWSI